MSVKAAPSTSHLVQLPLSPSSSFDSRRLPHLSKLLSYHDVAHRHLQHHPHQHRPHQPRHHLGLRTPPVDEMSTTYQQAPAAYDSHALRSYASSIAHPRTSTSAAVASHDARNAAAQYYRYPTQQSQTAQSSTSQSRTATLHGTPSDRSTKSATPASSVSAKDAISSRRSPETLIYHSLQIPRCISSNGGSLADFAAQVRRNQQFQATS